MIYLDNAATTACLPEVVEAMLPFFTRDFANASSIDHIPGASARRAVDAAREDIAALVGGGAEDVIFTSGSTEANNLALTVPFRMATTPTEHPSILDTFVNRRTKVDALLELGKFGNVSLESLRGFLQRASGDALVSIIATNNETGIEQDVAAVAAEGKKANALVHFDATQAVATRAFEMKKMSIAGISLSAHKFYGPKGVGALVASRSLRHALRPFLLGGGHERGFRSGTLNVPGIVGFGVAAKIALRDRVLRRKHLASLRSGFIDTARGIVAALFIENFDAAMVSPHVLSLRIQGVNGRALLRTLRDEVAFSLGSACATNKSEPSHVLSAMGFDKRAIAETIRISFSANQSMVEVVLASRKIAEAARDLCSYSSPQLA